jgi:hypothetical protein
MSESERAATYRLRAAECVLIAHGIRDARTKAALLRMAASWLWLAERAAGSGVREQNAQPGTVENEN